MEWLKQAKRRRQRPTVLSYENYWRVIGVNAEINAIDGPPSVQVKLNFSHIFICLFVDSSETNHGCCESRARALSRSDDVSITSKCRSASTECLHSFYVCLSETFPTESFAFHQKYSPIIFNIHTFLLFWLFRSASIYLALLLFFSTLARNKFPS